jgi:hypothetical protein
MVSILSQPIISLHVPKCGGTSLQTIFYSHLLPDYRVLQFYPGIGINLQDDWNTGNTLIHGHFIRRDGYSIETVCPGATHYVTCLRDPYDICVSAYKYGRIMNFSWATQMTFPSFIRWMCDDPWGPLLGALPEWKADVSLQSYVSTFLAIGTVNNFNAYLQRLSELFSLSLSTCAPLNASDSHEAFPPLREMLEEAHPKDFQLFQFVNALD